MAESYIGTFGDQAITDLPHEKDVIQSINDDNAINVVEPAQEKWRNHIGFWILGLTNNFAYVVMLSAAFDILGGKLGSGKTDMTKGYSCNPHSTGVILLADILPTLAIKWTAPFYMQSLNYHFKVILVVLFALGSFLMVALCKSVALAIIGVVFASISSGFGELTFLSLTSYFHSTVISSWSSGTGAAGVSGAFAYAGLTSIGVSPKQSILLMLVVPVLMAFGHWVLLKPSEELYRSSDLESTPLLKRNEDPTASLTFMQKLKLIKPLVKYMIPLFCVYLAEYTINQGLFELLYYPSSSMNHSEQYRWLQFCYQFGVLISRSSVNVVKIEKIELLAALQYANFIVLYLEVYYRYIPSIWITLAIVLFEGLIAGGVYVNAFFRVANEVDAKYREFSMGAASMADSPGITLAGVLSMPLHKYLCTNAKAPR